jgi:hypothetical protein
LYGGSLELSIYVGRTEQRDHVQVVRGIYLVFFVLFFGILRHTSRISQNVEGAALSRPRRRQQMSIPVSVEDGTFEVGGSNTLTWFLTGAVVGVAVALLYAPRSGKDARQFLSEKTQEGKEAVTESTRGALGTGRDLFDRGRKLVEDAADLFDRGRRLVRGEDPADV